MKKISTLSSQPSQQLTFVLDNGNSFVLSLKYQPTQEQWIYNIETENFSLKGARLVNSSNILHQYKNILDFGIACISQDEVDPFLDTDFTTRTELFVMDKNDIEQVESNIIKAFAENI